MTLLMSGGGATTNKTAEASTGQSSTDQVNLGGNQTPDFAKMRELKRQRTNEATQKFTELMGEPSATATTQAPKPAPKTENKSWLDKMTDAIQPSRSSKGESRIRPGGGSWGVQSEGSNITMWSDGDVTMSEIHAWEKMNYN